MVGYSNTFKLTVAGSGNMAMEIASADTNQLVCCSHDVEEKK